MPNVRGAWLFAAAGLVFAGCVDKKKPEKEIDPAYIQAHLLSEVPELANEVNADFGGKVIYLGNNVSSETIEPGGKVTIDHYWRVVEPPGDQWRIFAHVAGSEKEDWMNVDYTDMRVGYPAKKWRAGDIIWDEQKFALAKDWHSPHADVLVGLYPKGKHSIEDRMTPKGGTVDDQRRVRAVRLKVATGGAAKSEAPKPSVVHRSEEPITIDGEAKEKAWKTAPESPDFEFAEKGPTNDQVTNAKLLWDDENLYVFVHAEDDDIYSQYTKHDDPLWKEDVVELFIDADGNGKGYVELQVNPNNAQFDAWFPQTRRQKSHKEWKAGMKSAVKAYGSVNNRDEKDQAWDVEIAIPLEAVKGMDEEMDVTIPPEVGDTWKLNIVRGEKPKEGGLVASSWNRISYSDFHGLDRMVTVTFGDAEGSTEPPAEEPEDSGDGDEEKEPPKKTGEKPGGGAVLKKRAEKVKEKGKAKKEALPLEKKAAE